MNRPLKTILLFPPKGTLAGPGLDEDGLFERASRIDGVYEARRVAGWTPERLGPTGADEALVLVGRANPVPGLEPPPAFQAPVDARLMLKWMSGSPLENALALIRAAVARAGQARAINRGRTPVYQTVLVIGEGPAARASVEALRAAGLKVMRAGAEADSDRDAAVSDANEAEVIAYQSLAGVEGFAGRFIVSLHTGHEVREVKAGAVFLCGAEHTVPSVAALPARAVTLSEYEKNEEHIPDPDRDGRPSRIVFLAGNGRPASTSVMRRVMACAARAAEQPGAAAYVLAPQIKVAGPGLERLYARARQAGVTFIRTQGREAAFDLLPNGRPVFRVYDRLVRAFLNLAPDMLVVDEALVPADGLGRAAQRLGLETAPDGFPAPDNVLFLTSLSNRRGIFVLGPARGTDGDPALNGEPLTLEIRAAVAETLGLLNRSVVDTDRLIVDIGRCTICLTCVRVCPHQALGFTNRPWADPVACVQCGLCAAACPMDAIQIAETSDRQVTGYLTEMLGRPREDAKGPPRLVMFGCERSAMTALGAAPPPKGKLDLTAVPLPCAGRMEDNLILTAFQKGADGVLVAACHRDNCRTQHGSPEAAARVAYTRELLREAGIHPDRLRFITTAPNSGPDLARAIEAFSETVDRCSESKAE